MGMKYGWEFCEVVNAFIKSESSTNVVFILKNPTKGAGSHIHMVSMIGDELLTMTRLTCSQPILAYVSFSSQSLISQVSELRRC